MQQGEEGRFLLSFRIAFDDALHQGFRLGSKFYFIDIVHNECLIIFSVSNCYPRAIVRLRSLTKSQRRNFRFSYFNSLLTTHASSSPAITFKLLSVTTASDNIPPRIISG